MPEAEADLCAPNVNYSQVNAVYIGTGDNPFTNWEDLSEWLARIDNADVTDATKLRKFHTVGDKPAPEKNKIDFSQDRTLYSIPKHTLNLKVDETGDKNYEFIRWLELNPGQTFRVWYQVGKYLYGGNNGVPASVNFDDIIDEDKKTLNIFAGTVSWEGVHPERALNPMA